MKTITIVLLTTLLCGTNVCNTLAYHSQSLKDYKVNKLAIIDSALTKLLENLKPGIKASEPILLADYPVFQTGPGTNFTALLTNNRLSNLHNFNINKIKSSLFPPSVQFDFTFPSLLIKSKYTINGTIYYADVKGDGDANTTIENVHTWGILNGKIIGNKLHIIGLKCDYTVEDVKIKTTGLQVEGLEEDEVDEALSTIASYYVTNLEPEICKAISTVIVKKLNSLISGLTIRQIIQWIENHIQ